MLGQPLSDRGENALVEQIDFGPAVHHPFPPHNLVMEPFHRPLAPPFRGGRLHGYQIPAEVGDNVPKFRNPTLLGGCSQAVRASDTARAARCETGGPRYTPSGAPGSPGTG
jgi:hypothetical protein